MYFVLFKTLVPFSKHSLVCIKFKNKNRVALCLQCSPRDVKDLMNRFFCPFMLYNNV